ncbi:MAG: TonB-dependent siderophore receptor [Steroidobacteraceae bacterium]
MPRATALIVGVLTATSGWQASAQDSDSADGLETVVITSVRQAYRGDVAMKDLPQNISVIPEEILKDVNATQLDTVLDLASGVARQNTFGGLWDSFAIRGFAGDENTPSGYLVNGFSGGRGFSGRRDTSNIASIEVLKGPGSALYGRGEPGGTINIVTKKPEFDRSNAVELSISRFSAYRVAIDSTGPISDNAAYRVNGSFEDAQSFRDTVESRKYSITPSVFFRLGDATGINYELELVNQKAPFDRGVVAVNNQLGLIPNSRFLGEPADGPTKIDGTGHQLTVDHRFNSNWAMLAGLNYRESSFTGFSSDPELVNGRQLLFVNPAAGDLTRQRRFRDYDAKDSSARFELSGKASTGALDHHMLFGADTYEYKLDTMQTRYRPTLATAPQYAINIFNPVYGATPGTLNPLTDQREKQTAWGAYVQDQMDLTEQFKVLLGVRYDSFTQEFTNVLAGGTKTKQTGSKTSPRVGLVFEVNDRATLYASFSRGYRPNSGTGFGGTPFPAEVSESTEVGAKLQTADGRLSSTIAIFQGKKSNFLTSDPVNAGFSIAGGDAKSDGIELDLTAKLAENTTAIFSYAYLDARTTKAILDVNFGFSIPAGSDLINIPEHSAHLLVRHDAHLANGGVLSLGGDVGYVGDRLGETGFQPEFRLPGYVLLNLMAAYAPSENLKFSLHLNNALDKVYYPSSYSRFWVAPGAPVSYTAAVEFKF